MTGTQQAFGTNPQTNAGGPGKVPFKKAHVIVVGNEKGGSGKTTATMHLMVGLLRLGFSVGSMDLDSRQRSLTRYIENRRQTVAKEGISLPVPSHIVINRSPFNSIEEAKKDERERFAQGLAKIFATSDFVVIDTPGSDTYLSRLAHSFADTVITPINDSFVDLDVLASVDGRTLSILKPSIYSEMLWEQKLQRAKRDGGSIDWIVMRNRLSNIDARNKRFMSKVTEELARRIGFRVAPGFSERVIFREMFLQGLTVLDVMEANTSVSISMSHVAARQEVRDLLLMLKLDEVNKRMQSVKEKEEGKTSEEAEAVTTTPEVAAEPFALATPVQAAERDTNESEKVASANMSAAMPVVTPSVTEPVAATAPIAAASSSEKAPAFVPVPSVSAAVKPPVTPVAPATTPAAASMPAPQPAATFGKMPGTPVPPRKDEYTLDESILDFEPPKKQELA